MLVIVLPVVEAAAAAASTAALKLGWPTIPLANLRLPLAHLPQNCTRDGHDGYLFYYRMMWTIIQVHVWTLDQWGIVRFCTNIGIDRATEAVPCGIQNVWNITRRGKIVGSSLALIDPNEYITMTIVIRSGRMMWMFLIPWTGPISRRWSTRKRVSPAKIRKWPFKLLNWLRWRQYV